MADVQGGAGGSWNQGDVIVFASNRSPLQQVPASGGTAVPVTTLDPASGDQTHESPFFLPDGRHFLYLAVGSRSGSPFDSRAIFLGSLTSREPKLILEGGSNAQYTQGHLLFVRQGALMAQEFNSERLELKGEAVVLAEQVHTEALYDSQRGAFSVSPAGTLAYQAGSSEPRTRLVWFDRIGKQVSAITDEAQYGLVELSPDGVRAAVSVADQINGTRDIWIFDLALGVRTRLTSGVKEVRALIWSPDGNRIAFRPAREGSFDIYQKASSGTGDEQALWKDGFSKYPASWSPDGRSILYYTGVGTPRTRQDLWILPLFGERKPFPFLQTTFAETLGRFSPDGRWIVYVSNESGRFEVYVAPFPGPGGKSRISTESGTGPRWRKDGREILYQAPDGKLMSAAVNGRGSRFGVGAVQPLFDMRGGSRGWDVSADGERFLINTVADEAAPVSITLVVNWTAGLRKPR